MAIAPQEDLHCRGLLPAALSLAISIYLQFVYRYTYLYIVEVVLRGRPRTAKRTSLRSYHYSRSSSSTARTKLASSLDEVWVCLKMFHPRAFVKRIVESAALNQASVVYVPSTQARRAKQTLRFLGSRLFASSGQLSFRTMTGSESTRSSKSIAPQEPFSKSMFVGFMPQSGDVQELRLQGVAHERRPRLV